MDDKETRGLASDLLSGLQSEIRYKDKLIYSLIAIILVLIIALTATNIYHIYQWSQFDTIVVDSGDGEGNANYVQGDNTGGIYIGEGYGAQTEEGELPGNQN